MFFNYLYNTHLFVELNGYFSADRQKIQRAYVWRYMPVESYSILRTNLYAIFTTDIYGITLFEGGFATDVTLMM